MKFHSFHSVLLAAVLARLRGASVQALLAALGIVLATSAQALPPIQTTPAQFDITGPIQKFTLRCPAPHSALSSHAYEYGNYATEAMLYALSCPADMVVNGQKIEIPGNTVITYPASFLTPYETFAFNPTGKTDESGFAVEDTFRLPQPAIPYDPSYMKPATYEASIQGNVLFDADGTTHYVAGLVHISQDSLSSAQGFINYIDTVTGAIYVGGTNGVANGIRLLINDPVGRYGRRTGPLGGDTQDIRFAVDDGNPTIHAETGYPLCIPRSAVGDPECPEANRLLGGPTGHLTSYTFPAYPADPAAGNPNFPGLNPYKQAPLEVGDYIDYAGTLAADANGPYVSAHTITANLGLYTTPGTDPAYMTQEVTIVGVGIPGAFAGPAEGTDRFKVVGFSTDIQRIVDVGFVDVDPCSGDEALRQIVSLYPNGSTLDPTGAAAANVPLGRFRSQILKGLPLLPAAKEIRTQIRGSLNPVTANGLESGQYTAPVSEYIFAENLGLGGLPIIANNFEDFSFLAVGHGPWTLYDPYGTVYGANPHSLLEGQLSSWPGASAPPSVSCNLDANGNPLSAPPLIVVSDVNATVGSTVTLNATASHSLAQPPNPVSYNWYQVDGDTNVVPINEQTLTPDGSTLTFTAPATPQTLHFNLTVTDTVTQRHSVKLVAVTVAQVGDIVAIPVAPTYRIKDGSWNVTANTTDVNASLSITAYNGLNATGTVIMTTRAMTRTTPGVGNWSFIQKLPVSPLGANNALSVKVTSSKGGSAVANVAVRTN